MKPRRVVVIGHGAAPAVVAIALHRAFARTGLAVEWIETPGEIPRHAVYAALPNLQALHDLLGIEEALLLREARGAFALGQQYLGFTGGGDYLHAYGPVGRPFAGLPFIQHWLRARSAGLPAGLADFARDAVAARNGRIRLADGREARGSAYGYHLDARGYAAALRAHALREGIAITCDPAPAAMTGDGKVASLQLSTGRTVEADLFVDATAAATILSALGDRGPESAVIAGCDRLLLGSARPLRPLPLYSRIAAHRAGWSALYPLQDRTGVMVAYDGACMSDDEAAALAGLPLDGSPEILPLAPVERRSPWIGNVVAIGHASTQPDQLAATGLHRLQIAVTHLVSLFPIRADAMPEAGIYNEELAGWNARLRDFDALPCVLNGRTGESFWDAMRNSPVSAELDARISLFGARGMVAQYNHDSFAEDEWQSCFIGLGLVPRSWDPQVNRIDEQGVIADFRDQLAMIRADVMAMDTHEAALARATAA